jgi:ABC-type Fe3+ transport system permease subunit
VISCYTFPFVFVLVANALDRMPGELEDASAILGGKAWTTARRVTIPLALPALVAGALVAFLQAMTLFGSPAILALPAGFHTMTTKIWSLFQYPPKPELAAAAAVPLLLLTDPAAAGAANSSSAAAAIRWSAANTARRASVAEGVALGGAGVLLSCCSIRCSCPISRCSTPRSRRTRPRW